MEEQPEAVLTRSSGGEERRLATSSRSGSLARKEAALDQDERGNLPRRGWRSRGTGRTERDRSPLYREGKRKGENERAGKTTGENDSVGRGWRRLDGQRWKDGAGSWGSPGKR